MSFVNKKKAAYKGGHFYKKLQTLLNHYFVIINYLIVFAS